MCGPGSSVGIASKLWAGRSGIESRLGQDFLPVQTGPGAHPASCKMGTESFPGVKCGRGVLLTTHPLLVPRSWKSRASGVLRGRVWGFKTSPKFRRPSKNVPKSTRFEKCYKLLNLGREHPQDVRKKGSKILKLSRFAIVSH